MRTFCEKSEFEYDDQLVDEIIENEKIAKKQLSKKNKKFWASCKLSRIFMPKDELFGRNISLKPWTYFFSLTT